MKKLMIAAAMVCAAVLSQAATFDWTTGSVWYGPAATAFANLKAGDILNSATSSASDNSLNALGKTGEGKLGVVWTMTMTITDAAGSETLDPASFTGYSSNKPKIQGVLSSDKVYLPTGEDKVSFSYTMVVEGKYTDADGNVWTLTSDTINGGTVSKGSLDELTFQTATAIPTKWTISGGPIGPDPIPEPTSGLLLLLGVAGLALKRKHA